VALIPGPFEVDAVGLKVSRETAVEALSQILLGSVYIASVCVVFSPFSPSTCFHGMVVHFAVFALVLLVYMSSSASMSATLSETASATTEAKISAVEVYSRSG